MMKLNQWRLRARVMAGFALVMVLLTVASIVGMLRVSALSQRIDHLVEADMRTLELARQWAGMTEANILRRIVALVVEDEAFVKGFTARSKEVSARIDKVQAELDGLRQDAESERLMTAVGEARKQYQAARDVVAKARTNGENVHQRAVSELLPAMERYLAAIDDYANHTRQLLQNARDEAQVQVSQARQVVMVLMVIALALGVVIANVITRSVTVPLGHCLLYTSPSPRD